jgi:hypothetical protein
MIKSWNHDNVQISQRQGTWATQVQNEELLIDAFKSSRNVILCFSVNKSMAFQGYVSRCPLQPRPRGREISNDSKRIDFNSNISSIFVASRSKLFAS